MNLARRKIAAKDTEASIHLDFDTRLSGRWLLAARVSWMALALTIVVLNALALPGVPASLLSPDVMQELHRLNLSPAPGVIIIMGLNGLCMVMYLLISALLFWRRSDDRMAFFCSLMLLLFGGAVFGFLEYDLPDTLIWNLAFYSLFFLGQMAFLTFFYLFPSGRFVPRWTRWCVPLYVVFWLVWFFLLGGLASGTPPELLILFLLTGVIAQVYRYRSVSTRAERQQTKWVVSGFALAILVYGFSRLISFLLPPDLSNSPVWSYLVGGGSVYLAFTLIPIFIGIAILRDQLFDIDLIISRTLVYGLLTAFVVGVYVLVVGYLGALFHAGNSLVISLLATGLVAVLFQPLREALQRGVNRLIYGQRDEPYRVISRLGQHLEVALAPDSVLTVIVQTVAQALKLPYAAIALKQEEKLTVAASYIAGNKEESKEESRLQGQDNLLHLPLLYQGEPVGELVLAPRARGESFTSADRRLLEDLARQIGVVAHTVRLTAALQLSRENLVTAREEERRRLRRDLHDGLGSALTSVVFKLDATDELLERDPVKARALLADVRAQTQASITDIRRLVYNLRPPILDEWGLLAALREHIAQYALQNVRVSLDAPDALPPLSAAVDVAVYRMVLESLANVIKHAHATTCTVRLALEGESLIVEVEDNGVGRPAGSHAGVGLTAMYERAAELGGTCNIEDAVPHGTRVRARFPLERRNAG